MDNSAIGILREMEKAVRVKTTCTLSLDIDGNLELRWMWKVLSKWPEEFVLIIRSHEVATIYGDIQHAGATINEFIRSKEKK